MNYREIIGELEIWRYALLSISDDIDTMKWSGDVCAIRNVSILWKISVKTEQRQQIRKKTGDLDG